jgi:hypothetical protein
MYRLAAQAEKHADPEVLGACINVLLLSQLRTTRNLRFELYTGVSEISGGI